MSSILDRYGIKEVADVTFYEIGSDGTPSKPVLYLDTLKVSTIEQTAETSDARGGKGNPKLVSWDYGKEITVTIEDALFSSKSMAIMFGNGSATTASTTISRVAVARVNSSGKLDFITIDQKKANGGSERVKVDLSGATTLRDGYVAYTSGLIKRLTAEDGTVIGSASEGYASVAAIESAIASAASATNKVDVKGQKIFMEYSLAATTKTITISGDTFPGTYYVTGDTYARSDVDGSDQFFQFIIPKAKMTAEQTITLEAEGDPSTFSMNLTVLRPEDGDMMKLVQYDLV